MVSLNKNIRLRKNFLGVYALRIIRGREPTVCGKVGKKMGERSNGVMSFAETLSV